MFADKSLKSNEKARQASTSSKALQQKAPSTKLTQRAMSAPNTLLTGDAAQLKKMAENNSLANLINTKPLQREAKPEEGEELLQQKAAPEEEEEPLQRKAGPGEEEEEPLQMKKENNTGIPDQLKAGVESLSGIDMSDVKVHYNSAKPAEVGALAYTQGTDIHVASGQEKHLAHEAWHVAQQAQGRVQPTTQLKDVAVNDDPGLEHEADVMGQKALSIQPK